MFGELFESHIVMLHLVFYIIAQILQTDKPEHKWMYYIQNKFHEAFLFDVMHQ